MGSIRYKIFFLIIILSLSSFTGFGIFMINASRLQNIARDYSEKYNESLAGESFYQFNSFLESIQASSGISQTLGENFFNLRDILSRENLAAAMLDAYRTSFARETFLLGGGAFYEPYAFYPDVYDFHCFVSKVLSGGRLPSENEVQWAGDEWAWDVDTYEEGWYRIALPKGWNQSIPRNERYYWSELYIDTSVDVLMVSVCLPIYGGGRIQGVATVDVSLSTLQEMVNSFTLPTPSAQIAGFSTVNGATFAVSGSNNNDIVIYPRNSWLNSLSQLKNGQRFSDNNLIIDGESYTLIASVHHSGIGLAVLVPNAEKNMSVNAVQQTNVITALVICLMMIGIIIITILALSRWIIAPIKQAFNVLENIAKGDLTGHIDIKGKDELAQMMRAIAKTQDSIKNMIINIKKESSTLSDIGNNLASNMIQTASAVNQINANIQNIKTRVINQSASVSETHATMGQLTENIKKLDDHVDNQNSHVSQASAAIEKMAANIQSVTSTLVRNSENVHALKYASEIGRGGLQEVESDIKEISKESEGLLEINSVMQNIASQTNLLSMNAAIEAAHAGEAGKGFAVVADEIRKLAENSSGQSKTIGAVLKKIKQSIDKITLSTENVLNKFEAIDASVNIVAEQEDNIRSSMEEQGQGSKRILESIRDVNDLTRKVDEGSEEMIKGAQEVIRESENLEKVTQDIESGMNDMASSADHVNSAVNHVNEISLKNREAVDVLMKEVSLFTVE